MDYYDEDIEDDVETNRWSDTDSNRYRLINVLEDAREENAQANLDQKLMVHNLRIMTLENFERNEERMEGNEPEHLLQPTNLGNRGKYELFDEWMDSIEHLDAFMTNKPTDMEVEEEATDYMDVDPIVLMLKEEEFY